MGTGVTGTLILALAWGYVAARVAHAAIHIGSNRMRRRLASYFVSWLFLLAWWIRIGVSVAFDS